MICLHISSVYFGLLCSYRHDGDGSKSAFSYDRERNCNKVKSNDCIKFREGWAGEATTSPAQAGVSSETHQRIQSRSASNSLHVTCATRVRYPRL